MIIPLTDSFALPLNYVDQCDRYFLLVWNGDYFSNLYYKSSGRIKREGITYQIIFDNSTTISSVIASPKVMLSFRKKTNERDGFVIVKPYFEKLKEIKETK